MKYDKLIRDLIPEKIESSGGTYKTHVATEEEYWDKLRTKMGEEVEEFLDEPSVEELADIVEVVYAIAELKYGGIDKLEEARVQKREERGGFEKRLILDESEYGKR